MRSREVKEESSNMVRNWEEKEVSLWEGRVKAVMRGAVT